MSRDYDERHDRNAQRNGHASRERQGGSDRKIAFAMTERDDKTFWTRVGSAFVNKDGSINVFLEALPVSGRLQLRDDERRREE
ncbi:MAG: hypothetical protein U0441_23275 [Polyangiaceae bacterium]